MSLDLLVFGADALDPRITEYMIAKGYMPTFADLLADDAAMGPCASRLSSNQVPHTGPAWTTIYTGLTEHDHGVTEGGWVEGDISLEPHYDYTVFSNLIEAGYRTGSFTMPITFPAVVDKDSDSWMVSGFPAVVKDDHDTRVVSPDKFHDLLGVDYDTIQSGLLNPLGDQPLPVERWAAAERKKRQEILPHFTDECPVDVLFYGTQIADAMGHRVHYAPRYIDGIARRLANAANALLDWNLQPPRLGTIVWREEMRRAYNVVDSILADLIDAYDPERVLVVSDHGFHLKGFRHSYLGTSLVSGDIQRPEYTTEVRSIILDALGVEDSRTGDGPARIDRSEDNMQDEDRAAVESQLEALGYIDEA